MSTDVPRIASSLCARHSGRGRGRSDSVCKARREALETLADPLLEVVWTDRAKAAWQRACFEANAHSRRERTGAHAAVPEVEFVLNPRSKERLLSAQIAEQALQYLLVYPSTCLGKPTAASRSCSVPANDPSRRRGLARRALPVGLRPPRTRINDLTATR